ncbi:MAG: hypothetical protein AAGG59_05445 [Bacteroidota bacterium]
MRFVQSPIAFHYKKIYSATANDSGRMQYHKITPGKSKERISRAEFITAYNTLSIIAVNPIQEIDSPVFQLEFYI